MKKEIIFSVLLALTLSPLCLADDSSNPNEGVRVGGVVYTVAKDRKIETINGITQPEDISTYVQRKVAGVDAQISDLRSRLDRMEKQMNSMVDLLKSNRSAQTPQNTNPPPSNSTKKKPTSPSNVMV